MAWLCDAIKDERERAVFMIKRGKRLALTEAELASKSFEDLLSIIAPFEFDKDEIPKSPGGDTALVTRIMPTVHKVTLLLSGNYADKAI